MSAVLSPIGRLVGHVYGTGDVRDYGYVADGVDGTDQGTDNAAAIARAIAENVIIEFPDGVALFSGTITLPVGKTLRGKGPRKTILRQISTATVAGITLGDVVSADISEGAHRILDLCIKTAANASAHGIRIGDGATAVNASMLDFSNLRIWSQQQETHVSAPVAVIAHQRGIYIQSAASAVFVANLRNVEIRAFDVGIDAAGSPLGANEWRVHAWILDCRIAVRLSNCSTWDLSGITVESAVTAARALYALDAVSNVIWNGGRWELTQADCFGIEGDANATGQNWRFAGINVLIAGDGSAIPGRKWTGTIPDDFVFLGYTATLPFLVFANSLKIDDSSTATHTRMMVYDVDSGTLERVTVGAADSGGAGFKVLRIPN